MVDGILVGVTLSGAENHTLAVLREAATRAGLDVRPRTFTGWADIHEIVTEVLHVRPRLVGVSIQTSEAAIVSLVLLSSLRRAGFAGWLVCGGHFSTLNAADILDAAPAVDAVVRLAGEYALVELIRRPLGAPILDVPGVVTRNVDGEVVFGAPALVPAAQAARPRSQALPRHLGFPAADLVVSRGCVHRCHYCCVAATSELGRAEARRAGTPVAAAGYARASVDDVAAEIGSLWRTAGARVINFMDDNVLPTAPARVVEWVTELRVRLDAAGVPPLAMSIQLRADAVTPASATALARLGIVRAYVGADGYSTDQLTTLGRRSVAATGPLAMQALAAVGIYPVCNALLIGPTLRFDDLAAEIDGLARIRSGPVHLLPIDVRTGTQYERIAASQGLLEGSFLWRHFRFADSRARQLAEIIVAVPARLHERSVPIALYDLGYNLGIAERLVPDLEIADARASYFAIAEDWNREQVRFLRAAHAAAACGDRRAARDVVAATRERTRTLDRVWIAECDAHVDAVARAVSARRQSPCRPHLRGRALSQLALTMSLAACGRSPTTGSTEHAETETTTIADTSTTGESATETAGSGSASSTGSIDPGSCPNPEDEARLPPLAASECLRNCSALGVFDEDGYLVDVRDGGGSELPAEIRQCVLELFERVCFPSLAGTQYQIYGHCWIA